MSDQIDQEISSLNERYQRIGAALRQAERRLPIVIEFIGPPKAYKSTVRDMVGRLAEKCGFRVFRPIEGASLPSQRVLRENLVAFNAWTGTYALQQLLESCLPVNQYDLVLFDRGIIDAICWFRALNELEYASDEASDAARNFFGMTDWQRLLDGIVLLICDPTTSVKREQTGHLARADKLATSDAFLAKLHEVYSDDAWLAQLAPSTLQLRIDTSDGIDIRRIAIEVAERLVPLLERAANPEYAVVPRKLITFSGFVPFEQVVDSLADRVVFLSKEKAEIDPSYKQLVAYSMVRSGDRILRLHRTGPANRPELRDKLSIGVGGHVESSDFSLADNLKDVLRVSLMRELREELIFDSEPEIGTLGWINDETIEAGHYHIAAVHEAVFEGGRVKVRPHVSDQEFGTADWGFVKRSQIFEQSKRYDAWSQQIIWRVLGGPEPESPAQELFDYGVKSPHEKRSPTSEFCGDDPPLR